MKTILKYSLLWLLLTSCTTAYHLPSQYQPIPTTQSTYPNPYHKVGAEYLYRTTIIAYNHTFSGLLAAKITAPNTWRVALTTDFGNTLFDFEKNNHNIKVHHIFPQLNKKIIIRTLTADFEKLFITHFTITAQYAKDSEQVWQSTHNNEAVYLFLSPEKELQQQLNTHRQKPYTTFTYSNQSITITHHTLNIKIDLVPF